MRNLDRFLERRALGEDSFTRHCGPDLAPLQTRVGKICYDVQSIKDRAPVGV